MTTRAYLHLIAACLVVACALGFLGASLIGRA